MSERPFYLPEDPDYTLADSARDSVRFAHWCLQPTAHGRWRAVSSFVDRAGLPMTWHDFGTLEGPGWAANAMGAAGQLYAWGTYDRNVVLQQVALGLVDHVLDDGFVQADGFVIPYLDVATGRFCLNFKHTDEWLCPGSLARIGLQMLWTADALPSDEERGERLRAVAARLAAWLVGHVQPHDGWYPRRCTPDGAPYLQSAEGGDDPFVWGSADGVYIPWLLLELTQQGLGGWADAAREGADTLLRRGGIYGSINHDTYDGDENVAHAEVFRFLTRAARFFGSPPMSAFAYDNALAGLERFQMTDDRNGVQTKGLLYMEDSWDTAYLWENAEAALAYLEAYEETGLRDHCCTAVTILRAIARHHHGPHGFLTEGVDWNNHVGREHHINGAEFGDIRYTEPLLNNLHHIEPALRFLQRHLV